MYDMVTSGGGRGWREGGWAGGMGGGGRDRGNIYMLGARHRRLVGHRISDVMYDDIAASFSA
jgi:hypothetical protein